MNYPASNSKLWLSALSCSAAVFLVFSAVELLLLSVLGKGYGELCNWDCGWYLSIAGGGYDPEPASHEKGDAADWAFFPLYPLLSRLVGLVFGLDVNVALVVTSKIFAFTAIFSFVLLVRSLLPNINHWFAAGLMGAGPYFIYGQTGYSESLFFTLSSLALYSLHQRNYVATGMFAGLLSACRIVGGSIGFSYLVAAWRQWRTTDRKGELIFGLSLIPAGLAAYMAYLHYSFGDALAFVHIQIAWNHAPGDFIFHVGSALLHPLEKWHLSLALLHVILAAGALVYLFRQRHYELFTFSLIATLIPLSTGLVSMPRYIWWQPPLLFAVCAVLSSRKSLAWAYFMVAPIYSCLVYVGWFSGKNWVI